MFVSIKKLITKHTRTSKLGHQHSYSRVRTYVVLICDVCQTRFERSKGSINPKRIKYDAQHVCSNCDQKRFAQSRGAQRRKIWNLSADSELDITKI